MSKPQEMLKKALKAYRNAYAPYSKFSVGAALRDEHGHIHAGCNTENASFGGTICAERMALGALVCSGARRVTEVLILTNTPNGCPPCGLCRQALSEFILGQVSSGRKKDVVSVHLANLDGICRTITFDKLFPLAFVAEHFRKVP